MKFLPATVTCRHCAGAFNASFLDTIPAQPVHLKVTCPACDYINRIPNRYSLLLSLVTFLPAAFFITTLVTSGYGGRSDLFAALLLVAFVLYSRLVFMLYFKLRSQPFV